MNKRLLSKVPLKMFEPSMRFELEEEHLTSAMILITQCVYIDQQAILIINAYARNEIVHRNRAFPEYRVFISKKEHAYATQDFTETKQNWTTKTLAEIIHNYRYYKYYSTKLLKMYKESYSFFKPLHKQMIMIYLKSNNTKMSYGIYGLNKFQEECNTRRRMELHVKEIDYERLLKKHVPRQLPSDFRKWISQDVMYKSRYICYNYDSKKKDKQLEGHCTHCNKDVLVDAPRHRASGVCPSCGSTIEFIASSKVSEFKDRQDAIIIQKYRFGLIFRKFSVFVSYEKNDAFGQRNMLKKNIRFYEEMRLYWNTTTEHVDLQSYGLCEHTKTYRWTKLGSFNTIKNMMSGFEGILYINNFEEMFCNSNFKYCGLDYFVVNNPGVPIKVLGYLQYYMKEPRIEHIAKMGLNTLTKTLAGGHYVDLNHNAKTIFDFLGIEKEDYKLLKLVDGDRNHLKDIKAIRKYFVKISHQEYKNAKERYKHTLEDLIHISEGMRFQKLDKYLISQVSGRKASRYVDIAITYKDYLKMAKDLGYDLTSDFVKYPKSLSQRHDEAVGIQLLRNAEKEAKKKVAESLKIEKRKEELLEKYSYSDKNYTIIPATDSKSIIQEGHYLHHCVANYVTKMAKNECDILFVRKNEMLKTPYFTMEIKNGEVLQCRGKYNEGMPNEVKAFVEKFKRNKLKKQVLQSAV